MNKRKVRFDAYRDMRRADADERQKTKGRITLAGTKPTHPIFNRDKRQHIINRVMDVLRDWRHSPFEHEGATIAGMRSALCLDGYGWHRSNSQAQEAVAAALRLTAAKRPTYDEGQREYVERDGACVWCGGEIDADDTAYGRTGKFCSVRCAETMRLYRAEEWDQRTSAINRAAAATIAKEKLETSSCLHCGTTFKPFAMDARGRKFCSFECAGASRRTIPERDCLHCGKRFWSPFRVQKFCGNACKSVFSRSVPPVTCKTCGTMFRPNKARQTYCSEPCVDRTRQPVFPRTCAWCSTPFMGRHATSKFCNIDCKSMEYQFRTGRKVPKRISPPVFDYVFRMAA